ncbi:hypothetical protein FKM82_012242 [Ascaphus truei]
MKCTGPSESQRLALLLENALQAEARLWKVPLFQGLTLKGTDISPMHYGQAVLWIEGLRSSFHFYPETFGLAVSILNRILASVKAQVKYLRCVAITCLVLAAKTNEEDEVCHFSPLLGRGFRFCMYSNLNPPQKNKGSVLINRVLMAC